MALWNNRIVVIFIPFFLSSCGDSQNTAHHTKVDTTDVAHGPEVTVTAKRIKASFIHIPESCPEEHYVYLNWNLHDFGKSKSSDTLELMAEIGREADIIAGQEVNAGSKGNNGDGPQAVAKLTDILRRKGDASWDSITSDRTAPHSNKMERYAYWWKSSRILANRRSIRLVKELEEPIEREPYAAIFHMKGGVFKAFSIHTVPDTKNSVREVEALVKSRELGVDGDMILSGDFNLSAKDTDPILKPFGFVSHIAEKTSIKQKVGKKGEYLLSQYDNIYTKGNIGVCASGTVNFPEMIFSPVTQENLRAAREISDHLPTYIVFYFKK